MSIDHHELRRPCAGRLDLTRHHEEVATDASLVAAIACGCDEALEVLHRRHARATYATAQRLLWDPAAAEDVVQDVFVSLWNHPERFDPRLGSLRALLLRWARRAAIDVLRSTGARRRREVIHATRSSEAAPQVDEEVIDLRLAEYVEETLAPLRDGHRTALELACLHGLTYREVAAHMAVPEGTVKTWIRTALRSLRATARIDATGIDATAGTADR